MESENSKFRSVIGRHKRWLTAAIAAFVFTAVWYFITRPRPLVLEDQVSVVGFSADGRVLATIDRNDDGYLWDPETGQSRDGLAGEVSGIPFPFSPDGRYHVSRSPEKGQANTNPIAVVKETKTKREVLRFHYFDDTLAASRLGFASNSNFFFAVREREDGDAERQCVWRLPDGLNVLSEFTMPQAISGDGKKLAVWFSEDADGERIKYLEIVRVKDGDQVC